ncbi:MAG: hypothetical protein ABSG64_11275 [Solirubrobacteraceae bacterium]
MPVARRSPGQAADDEQFTRRWYLVAGVVHIPWYATGFRGDQLEAELVRVSALATRYGATGFAVHRSRDDRYKLLQMLEFSSHDDWERFWYGPEMIDMRTHCQGWFQIPLLYSWNDVVTAGTRPARAGQPVGVLSGEAASAGDEEEAE